jgi:hypothetical protein
MCAVTQPGSLWMRMQFWEDVFYDAVAVERDIVGMDMEAHEMMARYAGLLDADRRRLEMEEDRLLATLMYNMTAFMVDTGAHECITCVCRSCATRRRKPYNRRYVVCWARVTWVWCIVRILIDSLIRSTMW